MSEAVRTVYPTLRYADPRAAIDWLVSTLGFTEHEVSTGPDGAVTHAELTIGTGMIMISPAGDEAAADKPAGITPGVYIAVDDGLGGIDAHHARAKAAGAEIIFGLTDQPYGSREYAVRDPEGYAWYLGTYRP
jgi:uncharacterized glyoxalase superfamily protein PhnB